MRVLSPRSGGTAALLVVALLVPLMPYFQSGRLEILTTTACYAIAALGLDILIGRTGQLSLAHGAFLGVGCYATLAVGGRGAPWPVAFAVGIAGTALVATLVGLPALRIRGLQVAVATMAFQLFAINLVNQKPVLASQQHFFDRPSYLSDAKSLYYLAVGLVVLVMLFLRRLTVTRPGRSLLAVRDIEARSEAFGINAGASKLLAYAFSGAIVGLGGALFAMQQGSVSQPDSFEILTSLTLVAAVVVGGSQSSVGVVIATVFLIAVPKLLPHKLDSLATILPIVFAAMLVLSVVLQPRGLGGLLDDLARRIEGRERPSPRPAAVPVDAAEHATVLREVPRRLRDRMPVAALLEATDVGVQYGGVKALQGVTLEVRRGEIVGLIGANGAGKSTFFNAVSGLAPVTGSIRYAGSELVMASPATRSRRGVARSFQDMGLVRAETVRDNVLMAQGWMARYPSVAGILALGSTVSTERELRKRADLALELFGLTHLRDERLGDLPYGTMRITEIAAAVSAGPELLLLDEATAGLTPEEAHALGDRFLALRSELGLTLVVIEHHVPLIARVCDYCYCLESGQQIADGPPDEVIAQPRVIASFLGRGSLASHETDAVAEELLV